MQMVAWRDAGSTQGRDFSGEARARCNSIEFERLQEGLAQPSGFTIA
jgi:hypothetical protein